MASRIQEPKVCMIIEEHASCMVCARFLFAYLFIFFSLLGKYLVISYFENFTSKVLEMSIYTSIFI